jgi:hypothetical protein
VRARSLAPGGLDLHASAAAALRSHDPKCNTRRRPA